MQNNFYYERLSEIISEKKRKKKKRERNGLNTKNLTKYS
jgi:hypothetical protein